jgi:iron complex outermembrane recepter protein
MIRVMRSRFSAVQNERCGRIRFIASVTCVCLLTDVTVVCASELDQSGRIVEEVVVTAQKRAENLINVPISMTVVTGDSLDRSTVEGVTEVLSRIPGVVTTVALQGGGTQFSVRGVTSGGPLFNGSNPVAYYLDSTPFGLVRSSIAPDSNAYDLQQIEVLRGPQGTLYGASTLNGVIRVLTHDADLEKFDFKARTTVSSTEHGSEGYRTDMAVNVPIAPGKLAIRAVGGYQDTTGWIDRPNKKDANDGTLRTLRLKVNAQPTNAFSVGASAWMSRNDYGAPNKSADGRFLPTTTPEPMVTDYDIFGLRIGYEFSTFSLSSSSGYISYDNTVNEALDDGSELFTNLASEVFSEEVLLSSKEESSWRWTAGAIYRNGEDKNFQTLTGLDNPLHWTDSSESAAVFGEIGRGFANERWRWTLGLRYFRDTQEVHEKVRLFDNEPLAHLEDTFTATTPRAVLTWYANPTLTIYGSYAQGFRSGFGQNPLVLLQAPDFPAVKPDKLSNYEVGAKGELLDGRISFDTAVYYMYWRDLQAELGLEFRGQGLSAPTNGSSASGVGVDLQILTRIVAGLSLGANVSWNDLSHDEDVIATNRTPNRLLYAKGERVFGSPEYTLGALAEYEFSLFQGWRAAFAVSANYASSVVNHALLDDGSRAALEGDSLLISRANFTIDTDSRWSAAVFVDNLSNEQGTPTPSIGQDIGKASVRIRPRTMGLQLDYHF